MPSNLDLSSNTCSRCCFCDSNKCEETIQYISIKLKTVILLTLDNNASGFDLLLLPSFAFSSEAC
jgi:hypothetical protein